MVLLAAGSLQHKAVASLSQSQTDSRLIKNSATWRYDKLQGNADLFSLCPASNWQLEHASVDQDNQIILR